MAAIGIDTHKATLAACQVDELGTALRERTFDNNPAGHRALLDWAANAGHDTVIGIEGSASFGAPLARFLVATGWTVREVPPQLSRRERMRTRRAGKSDPGDALAIARVPPKPLSAFDGSPASTRPVFDPQPEARSAEQACLAIGFTNPEAP